MEEAVQILGLSKDELKRMAQKKEIRSFMDRGSLRFRRQDLEETAKRLAADEAFQEPVPDVDESGSDYAAPSLPQKKAAEPPEDSDDFSLALDSEGDVKLINPEDVPQPLRQTQMSIDPIPPKKPSRVQTTDSDDALLAMMAASDSDVKLVAPGPAEKPVKPAKPSKLNPLPQDQSDSDVKLVVPGSAEEPVLQEPISPEQSDSDIKLVAPGSAEEPLMENSLSATDSDLNLEGLPGPASLDVEGLATSEIPIEHHILQQDFQNRTQLKSKSKVERQPADLPLDLVDTDEPPRPKSKLKKPESSDIDLTPSIQDSGADEDFSLDLSQDQSDLEENQELPLDQSSEDSPDSDFELNVEAASDQVPIEQEEGESDFQLNFDEETVSEPNDESEFELNLDEESVGQAEAPEPEGESEFELNLEEGAPQDQAEESDIQLSPEVDEESSPEESEFSLNVDDEEAISDREGEESFSLSVDDEEAASDPEGEESEFSLSVDDEEAVSDPEGEESEFSLSVDDEESVPEPEGESEFELSVDEGEAAAAEGEESEFQLSLDEDESETAMEGEAEEEGSGSEFELTLDESAEGDEEEPQAEDEENIFEESEFEVALDDSESQVEALDEEDISVEDESTSQVVALDEEEAEEGADTMAGAAFEEGFEGLDDESLVEMEEEEEEEEEEEPVGAGSYPRPAPWGPLPVILMFPSVIVMVLVGIMGFELIQNMGGYRPPGLMTKTVMDLVDQVMGK